MMESGTTKKNDNLGKRDLARLLDYYRMRVETFEKERVEWMERLEGLRLSQEEHHRLEWELRRRTDEIVELQNALNDSHLALNGERKQIINLTEEIENSKMKTKEDRRRLVQLLQLAEPVEQTIKLFYDRRPEKLEKFSNFNIDYNPDSIALNKSLNVGKTKQKLTNYQHCRKCNNCNSSSNLKKKCLHSSSHTNSSTYNNKVTLRISPSDEKQHIVRTIMLPNEEIDNSLKSENEYLQSQLINLKDHYENQIFRMDEDRRLREEEIRLREANYKEKIEELMKKNQKLEKLNYELTKDHMQLKYDSSNTEKKLYEELEIVKLQSEALEYSLKDILHRTSLDKETTKTDYERKTREITNVMRTQVKTQEENNTIIKEQYKQIQKIYTSRVKELEDKLKTLTNKHKNLENKRSYEIEGYINEINLMRKRLKSYEEYVTKIRYMANNGEFDMEGTRKVLDGMKSTNNKISDLSDRLKEEYKYRNTFNTGAKTNLSQNEQEDEREASYENNQDEEDEFKSDIAMEDL